MEDKKVLINVDDARREILREAPEFAYIIDRIKPADAVEVVRCEDCINRFKMKWAKCNGRRPDDFCSDGVRRWK